ncbi:MULTISPECIES: AAA family ATPase [Brevibacterium]|uniref:AAA family ATPase n=1 Tax=Brevibacterium TaxID=1696 RepID=UPI0014311EA3|nr:AAA family ATPase [Brevibacterium casei]
MNFDDDPGQPTPEELAEWAAEDDRVETIRPKPGTHPTSNVQRIGRVTWASDIPMEVQKWLVPDMVPLGTLTIFAGKGGEGKSTMALNIAAELSRGQLDGDVKTAASTLILSVEDGWGTVMVPRLTAAGADISKIGKFDIDSVVVDTGEAYETKAVLPIDINGIRDLVIRYGVKLIILDPANSFMEGDTNKVLDVRRAFEPVSRLAQDADVAVILIAHFGKGGGSMSDKLSGSHAWRDLARSYWAFATDEDTGKRVFTQDKSNYGKHKGSYEFSLESVPVEVDDSIVEVGVVKNIAATDVSVADLINRDYAPDEDDGDCEGWLLDYLDREPFEFLRADVVKDGRKEGFSEDQLKRAKRKGGVNHDRTKAVPSRTVWQHPRLRQDTLAVPDAPTALTGQLGDVSPGHSTQSTVRADTEKRPDCALTELTRENAEPTTSQSSQSTSRARSNQESDESPAEVHPTADLPQAAGDNSEPDAAPKKRSEAPRQQDLVLDYITEHGASSPKDIAAGLIETIAGFTPGKANVYLGRLHAEGTITRTQFGVWDLTDRAELQVDRQLTMFSTDSDEEAAS